MELSEASDFDDAAVATALRSSRPFAAALFSENQKREVGGSSCRALGPVYHLMLHRLHQYRSTHNRLYDQGSGRHAIDLLAQ